MQDEDLTIRSKAEGEVCYYARFSGVLKEWPMLLYYDREPYRFAGQEALDPDDAGTWAGSARYVRDPRSGN